jgi:hypothetical protein
MNVWQLIYLAIFSGGIVFLIYVGGFPDRKLGAYYILTGSAFFFVAVLVSFLVKESLLNVLLMREARMSTTVPLGIGYTFIIVGLLGVIRPQKFSEKNDQEKLGSENNSS